MARLVKQVQDEVPSEEELCNLLKNYFEAQGRGGIDGVSHNMEGLPGTVDAAILSCGSCGVRRPQRSSQKTQKMIKVSLRELVGSPLEYSGAEKESWEKEKCLPPLYLPHNANGDLTKFDTWKLRSAFDSNDLNTTFHLHPELVVHQQNSEGVKEQFTFLCTECAKCCQSKAKRPVNSIAAGLDLGDFEHIGLVEPSLSELCLIA